MKHLVKQLRHGLDACLILLFASLLLSGCSSGTTSAQGTGPSSTSSAAQTSTARVGSPAPDFQLQTFSGHPFHLSDLRGKKVVLNFWASWCGPCKNEMPALQKTARQYTGQVEVYGVNMTSDDSIEKANAFLMEQGVTFPNLVDDKGVVKNAYHIIGYPVSIAIDETGKIVERHDGGLSAGLMQAMFQHLVSKKKAITP